MCFEDGSSLSLAIDVLGIAQLQNVCSVPDIHFVILLEVFESRQYLSEFAPVQVIILVVLAGIIGLVITAFTSWHMYLCVRGQTTIECLEKTRYLAGVRKKVEQNRNEQHYLQQQHKTGGPEGGISESLQRAGGQLLEIHANAVPGAFRYEEGEEHSSPTPSVRHAFPAPAATMSQYSDFPAESDHSPAQQALRKNYTSYETDRERERYEDYLDDKETAKMPNAFDLGWRKNLIHVFGLNHWLWLLPVCNTTGDGRKWEVSQKWMIASEEAARRKEQRLQQAKLQGHWSGSPVPQRTAAGAGRHYRQEENSHSYDDSSSVHGHGSMSMQSLRKSRKQRRDYDLAGDDGDVGSFEVSDSDESSPDSGSDDEHDAWKK
ncbi:palmitoyltransferase for Vac8p [Lithohypha guttulata]|uniref:Palmitoyltransferase for Vac8p n=1 Tax=Lithohypha guttulata TaxID=1690604 RepID=A0AAN7SWH4_9EURO|nr:palmitoyltransferase for Vac8p [Lithohypha guttulata]